jgi:hypothetical protein
MANPRAGTPLLRLFRPPGVYDRNKQSIIQKKIASHICLGDAQETPTMSYFIGKKRSQEKARCVATGYPSKVNIAIV